MDETVATSLVTLIENLLTFQEMTLYNTMMSFGLYQRSKYQTVQEMENICFKSVIVILRWSSRSEYI